MATSTIFRNIVLTSEEDVTSFVDAMEQSQNDVGTETAVNGKLIEDENELKTFLDKVVSANA